MIHAPSHRAPSPRAARASLAAALFALLAATAFARAADVKAPYPPVPAPSDPAALGAGIQRTMTLLATSTPDHRNTVRILFYGQSITEQDWSKQVADDLRRRFPSADLQIENRAIGGFASQRLVRPAEHDLYPFYPDLLIFHVYGGNKEYEEIIRNTRSRTAAEVLMQTDHLTRMPPETVDPNQDKGAWWDDLMNRQILPNIARKYGCGLVDNHTEWLRYLKANKLEPKDLLKDGVHLNDHGNYLMAELVKRYLVHRPDLPGDAWKDLSRDYEVGKDVRWENGKLTLAFEGNRVDVLAGPKAAAGDAPVAVTIDGKKPSEWPGCYAITRPQPGPWSPLTVVRVDHDRPLVLEDWTLKVTSVEGEGDATTFAYEVRGSQTGPDGAGTSKSPFASLSGRVRIDPESWFRNGAVPAGYEIKWQVRPLFRDEWTGDAHATLAQGLPNARHTLQLSGAGAPSIRAIRVYRPPVKPE